MKKIFLTSEFFVVAKHIFAKFITEKNLNVLFIPTASEQIPGEHIWEKNDLDEFKKAGHQITEFSITGKSLDEIRTALLKTDIIYILGGNVFYLLQQIQKTKSKELFRDAVMNQNKIYVGGSAGSMIASPDVSARNYPGHHFADTILTDYTALHLVDFLIFPHWRREDKKEQYLNHQMKHAFSVDNKLILLSDNQYVQVIDDMYKIIDITKD